MSVYDVLAQAIEERRVVTFTYIKVLIDVVTSELSSK